MRLQSVGHTTASVRTLGTLLLFCASAACRTTPRPADARALPPASVPLFSFHNNFWFNLHHVLYGWARHRHGLDDRTVPALAGLLDDTLGIGTVSPADRRAWDAAVTYYDTAYVAHHLDFDSSPLIAANYVLADRETMPVLTPAPGLPPGLVAALNEAAPTYRRLWWPGHHHDNAKWIASMRPYLREHGSALARALVHVYEVPWPGAPVRVEVVAYANWAGAYTTTDPTLVTIASRYHGMQGTLGLETLFHEPSHAMLDSVNAELRRAGVDPHSGFGATLTHAVIFFTAGELTRRAIPSHVPYAERRGFWAPGQYLGTFHQALVDVWKPYLDGRSTLTDAVRALVRELASTHSHSDHS